MVLLLAPVTAVSAVLTDSGWVVEGGEDLAYLGFSTATAGDVDGDGYSDVIVGAYLFDATFVNEGLALVYHGSASGLPLIAYWRGTGVLPIGTIYSRRCGLRLSR